VLGLPDTVTALLFDLDGVLTQTAKVHDKAWKETFDAYLKQRDGDDFTPFDADADYVEYVGNRKNELVLEMIKRDGVQPYKGSVRFVKAAREAGLRRAVVSSSANCRDVLIAAGIEDLFEARIDGVTADEQHLRGKPHPDTFLAGARALGVAPAHAAVFEDALAGVQAGRDGEFGYVVGVDRVGQAKALREHGASVVVSDLDELLTGT